MGYFGGRSSQLSLLRLVNCHYYMNHESWRNFFKKVPLLKELSLKFSSVLLEAALVEASRHCPMLTTIKIRVSDNSQCLSLNVVLAIAMGMTQLRHLQLSGFVICRKDLEVIVSSGCTHLETLDLTACVSASDIISLSLREKCNGQIEDMRFPADWMEKFMKDDADFSEMM